MKIEQLTNSSPEARISQAAELEAAVILEQVFNRSLPTIDLNLPIGKDRITRLRLIGLRNFVVQARLSKMKKEFPDPNRMALCAIEDSNVRAVGRINFRPEIFTAVLYGFYVQKEFRASHVIFDLLSECVERLDTYHQTLTKPLQVRINRYVMTERKQPAITHFAQRVNAAYPADTIAVGQQLWGSQPYQTFTTDFRVFAALVDTFSDKIGKLIE